MDERGTSIRLSLVLLSLVPFVMVLGNSMLIPILPQLREAMGISWFQTGLVITAFSLPAGLTIPFAGMLSDRIGRKRVMAPALIVYGLGGLFAGLGAFLASEPYPWVLGGRIVQGVGSGGTYQLAMALAGDLFGWQGRTKVLGILESSNGMGKVISPVAGAAAALLFWFLPFFVYGAVAIPVGVAVYLFLRDPVETKLKRGGATAKEGRKPFSAYLSELRLILRRKGVSLGVSYLSGMVALLLLFGLLSHVSDVLEQRTGITGIAKGLVIAAPVLAMALTSYISGVFLQERLVRWGRCVVAGGLTLTAVSLAWQGLGDSIPALHVSTALVGVGTGLVLPALNSLITGSASSNERGIVTATYGTVRFFGVAFGPPLFGWTVEFGELPMLLVFGGLAFVVGIVVLVLLKEKAMVASPEGTVI